MQDRIIPLFNCLYPQYTGGAFAGMCYDPRGISPTILTMGGVTDNPTYYYATQRQNRIQIPA